MAVPAKFGIVQPVQRGRVEQEFDAILQAVREASPENLPDLIGKLESIKAVAWARLAAPSSAPKEHDELLSAEVAAERLGVSRDYLYRHHSQYSFTRRQGRKLLFSSQGIERFI